MLVFVVEKGYAFFSSAHAMNLCMLRLAFMETPLSVSSLHFIFPILFVRLYDDDNGNDNQDQLLYEREDESSHA